MDTLTDLTVESVRALFHYNPDTGSCIWKKRPISHGKMARWNTVFVGTEVGSLDKDGYRKVFFGYRSYRLHRLIWLYVYGVWPSTHLDHVNRDPADNRIDNLREATPKQNSWNRISRRISKTGYVGVQPTKCGKRFLARPFIEGKLVYCGTFDTAELASAAVQEAILYRGEFLPTAGGP